jgi:hypothetical protein
MTRSCVTKASDHIGVKLRQLYSQDLNEPIPQSLYDLLNQLDQNISKVKPTNKPGTKREKF